MLMSGLRQAGKMDYSSVEEIAPQDHCFDERATRAASENRRRIVHAATTGSPSSSLRDLLDNKLAQALSALALQHQQALLLVEEFNDNVSPYETGPTVLPGTLSSLGEESVYTKVFEPGITNNKRNGINGNYGVQRPPSVTASIEVQPVKRSSDEFLFPRDDTMRHRDTMNSEIFERSSEMAGSPSGPNRCRSYAASEDSPVSKYSPSKKSSNDGRKQRQIRRPGPVFADATKMKEQVKEALRNPEYNVTVFYKTVGIWQAIARHHVFDNITLLIIGINSIWLAIDTDHNTAKSWADTHWAFILGENVFCIYFLVEIIIRFMAFDDIRNCLRDAWFVFDTALVAMMVGESWIMNFILWVTNSDSNSGLSNMGMLRLIRLLRMTRMLRMARLMRAIPELMILLKGIKAAMRSVFFTLCLLVILIYVFAIALVQLCEDTDLGISYFPNVPQAMNNLLLRGTLPDLADFVEDAGKESWFLYLIMLFFILLSSLTVLNMLVGVLVEVVSVVSAVEKEQMTVNYVKTELGEMLLDHGTDTNGNKHITKPEFLTLLMNPIAVKIIAEIGVDVVGLVDYADFIFDKKQELSFPDFMELVMQLRGSNMTTVKDMVDFRQFMTKTIQETIEQIERLVQKTEHRIGCRLEDVSKRRLTDGLDRRSLRPTAPAANMLPSPAVIASPIAPAPTMPIVTFEQVVSEKLIA